MKTITLVLFLILGINTVQAQTTTKVFFTKSSCSFEVYKHKAVKGTKRCENFEHVGTIYAGRPVSITINKGEEIVYRVMCGGYDACVASKNVLQGSIRKNANDNKNYTNKEEISCNICD